MSKNIVPSTDPALRATATLLFAGILLSLVAGFFHPDHAYANDHVAAFTEYANSHNWTAIHLGQFAGMAVIISGLMLLSFSLERESGMAGWPGRFGAITALVALALYAVLQAVDGVALKQAVDAWVAAPEAEKMMRFTSAETVRWLEWAIRSYQSYVLGLSFVLFGIASMANRRIPRMIGVLMGISGLAYLAQGWVIGSQGFSPANSIPTLLGIVSTVVWGLWFVIVAWQNKQPVATRPEFVGR